MRPDIIIRWDYAKCYNSIQIMNSFYRNFCVGAFASLGFIGSAVFAQQMLPKIDNGCPNGTSSSGQGYCRVNQGTKGQFIQKMGNGCPNGTSSAGQGYCRTNN